MQIPEIHTNTNRSLSFFGFPLYQCTVTNKTIPFDFHESNIRSIGSHIVIHHPDIRFYSFATKEYTKWFSLAHETFFLGIVHILMKQKAKLVLHSKQHTFLFNSFRKTSKDYRLIALKDASSCDLFSSVMLACIHKITKEESGKGISLFVLSKLVIDHYIGSQYLHHTPEKSFLEALLKVYNKEYDWFQLNIAEAKGFRKEYSISIKPEEFKEVSVSHLFFENNVADTAFNTPILYQLKKELFNTLRFEFSRRKSGREAFVPYSTDGEYDDYDFDFNDDFD